MRSQGSQAPWKQMVSGAERFFGCQAFAVRKEVRKEKRKDWQTLWNTKLLTLAVLGFIWDILGWVSLIPSDQDWNEFLHVFTSFSRRDMVFLVIPFARKDPNLCSVPGEATKGFGAPHDIQRKVEVKTQETWQINWQSERQTSGLEKQTPLLNLCFSSTPPHPVWQWGFDQCYTWPFLIRTWATLRCFKWGVPAFPSRHLQILIFSQFPRHLGISKTTPWPSRFHALEKTARGKPEMTTHPGGRNSWSPTFWFLCLRFWRFWGQPRKKNVARQLGQLVKNLALETPCPVAFWMRLTASIYIYIYIYIYLYRYFMVFVGTEILAKVQFDNLFDVFIFL